MQPCLSKSISAAHYSSVILSPLAPEYTVATFKLLLRELDRKQGMIDDLHQMADEFCGLDPEDCRMLTAAVHDRNAIEKALEAMGFLFGNLEHHAEV